MSNVHSANKKYNSWDCEVAAIERTLQKTLFLHEVYENLERLLYSVITFEFTVNIDTWLIERTPIIVLSDRAVPIWLSIWYPKI